jgi:hypothetical protein
MERRFLTAVVGQVVYNRFSTGSAVDDIDRSVSIFTFGSSTPSKLRADGQSALPPGGFVLRLESRVQTAARGRINSSNESDALRFSLPGIERRDMTACDILTS